MNNIYISPEEISGLSESLCEEITRVKNLFGEIYDIKESFRSVTELSDDFSSDRKETDEVCDVFLRFSEFVGKVCTEYSKCEQGLSEMVDAIRI